MLGAYKGLKTGVATKDVDVSVGLTKNLGKLLFNEYVLPLNLLQSLFWQVL
jgi:NADH-quinone oxidoreductase subunit J